jgi:hypothetical protein
MDEYVDLYWLPLGAGGRYVRWNGRVYEQLCARREHRPARPLFHSALEVGHAGERRIIEMAPVWNTPDLGRGVQLEGPVGARWLGRWRAFRYEVRCWKGGRIPDVAEAVDSPQRLIEDEARTVRLLELVAQIPPYVWGRDELRCGDMWNSNSLVSWLLASGGVDLATVVPPNHGRAPGWHAGLVLAARQRPTGAAYSRPAAFNAR